MPAMRWFPDNKPFHLPENKQRFLIYATVKTILTIMITTYHHTHIIVHPGLNIICYVDCVRSQKTPDDDWSIAHLSFVDSINIK